MNPNQCDFAFCHDKKESLLRSLSIVWHSRPRLCDFAQEWPLKERKYSYRRNLPHIQKQNRAHFVTFNSYLRWELPPPARDLVLQHCLHDHDLKMKLYIAVVMPDHVHMIFLPFENELNQAFSLEEIVGAIKGASVHSVNKLLGRSGQVWQDESFDHVIRHAESLEDKIRYVRENPVRRGLVSTPEEYPWLWEG
jgi:REP-associated tyrosine transposase